MDMMDALLHLSLLAKTFYPFHKVNKRQQVTANMANTNFGFSTTFDDANPGTSLLGHPSMFQRPDIDNALDDDIGKAKLTDPINLWQTSVSPFGVNNNTNMASQYTVPYDPRDPPLNDLEKHSLIRKFRPIIDKTFDNRQPSMLFYVFFSTNNVVTLQNNIRYSVNRWSGHHVGEQSLTELTRIMETVFSTHAKHIDEYNSPSKMLFSHIRTEVGRLNELVVNTAVPIIIDGLEQHMAYMKRVDNPISAASLARPLDTKITGTTVFRSPTDVMSM